MNKLQFFGLQASTYVLPGPRDFSEPVGNGEWMASSPPQLRLRTCIGRHIAMVGMRLILARLLWKFGWELNAQQYNNPEYVIPCRSPLWMKTVATGMDQKI